jgi:hypothetical protein
MADATTVRARRTRRATLAVFAALACVGCCSIPFLAGFTIFGVALCSTKFLGVALGAMLAVVATTALVAYGKRSRRAPVGPVSVEFREPRRRVDGPS